MTLRHGAGALGILVLAWSAAAQAADVAKTVQGKWKVDVVGTLKESAMFQKLPPDGQKTMLEQASHAPVYVYEFTDKTMVATMGDKPPEKMAYKVLRAEGQVLAIRVTGKKGGPEETDLEVLDPDSMKMGRKGGEMPVILRRVK